MSAHALADALERDGVTLSLRVIDRMYREDPFWNERFGEAGRRHADSDAGRHIEHLVTALRAGSPAVFMGYARWLQSVLTTRGMCTRHLADNFTLLAEEIARSGMAGAEPAIAILTEGAEAIARTNGPAGEVHRQRAALCEATVTTLFDAEPSWVGTLGTGRTSCLEEADFFVDYLADALAHHAPNDLADYAKLVQRVLAKRELPTSQVTRMLGALREPVARSCPEIAASYVDGALAALSSP